MVRTMKKIFFLLQLITFYSWGQVTPDPTIKSNTNTLIRNATTVTRANHALINDELADSKMSRVENNSATGVNAYSSTISWVNAYAKGLTVPIFFASSNTGASTINISGLGNKSIRKNGSVLVAGDIVTGRPYSLVYDGIDFQLSGGVPGSGSVVHANNATTLSGDTVQFGGSLKKNTLVNLNNKNLLFEDNSGIRGDLAIGFFNGLYIQNYVSDIIYKHQSSFNQNQYSYTPDAFELETSGGNVVIRTDTFGINPHVGKTRFYIDSVGNVSMPNTTELIVTSTNGVDNAVVDQTPYYFNATSRHGTTDFSSLSVAVGNSQWGIKGGFPMLFATGLSDGSNYATRLYLDSLGNIKILPNGTTGTAGQFLQTDGSGKVSWISALKADGTIPLTSNWDVGGYQLKNLIDPSSAQDAATKAYVDAIATGLKIKTSVLVASTDTLNANTYANGASGVGATLTGNYNVVLVIDGVTPAFNDRILVKNESTASHNGIYTLTTVGSISVPYVLTRATDNDQSSEIPSSFVFIQSGTLNSTSGWVVIGPGPFTIGTTAINWTQFNGSNLTAGAGIDITGNVVSTLITQNISRLTNLSTKGIVKTDASGNLTSSNGTGFLKDNGAGVISYDPTTYVDTEVDPVVTSINGIVKSNGSVVSTAIANSDYQSPISLTVTGSSGASTFIANTLNVPTYTLSGLGGVSTARNINTASPITGGGDLSADRTIAINNAIADGSTKGAASFTANDFDTSFGNVSIDYTNGQVASGSNKGFLITSDWTNFNTAYTNRIASLTTTGSSGAATLISNTLNIPTPTVSGLGGWSLSNGGALTGVNNVTSNAANQLIFDGTFTASANNQYANKFASTITSRSTASDAIIGTSINHTLKANSTSIDAQGLLVNTVLQSNGGITTGAGNGLQAGNANGGAYVSKSTAGMTAATYTSISPASTSGSGTGAVFTVIVASATTFTSFNCTTTGSGYNVGETVTFNGSQFGSGSGSIVLAILSTSNSFGSNATSLRLVNSIGDYGSITKNYIDLAKADGVTSMGKIGVTYSSTGTGSLFFNDPSGQMLTSDGTTISSSRTLNLTGATTFTNTVTLSGTNSLSGANNLAHQLSTTASDYGILHGSTTFGFKASSLIHSSYKTGLTLNGYGVINTGTISGTGTNGTYTSVAMAGGTGTAASATVVVTAGNVSSITFPGNAAKGTNYSIGDILTGTITGGTATFTITGVDFAGQYSGFLDANSIVDAKSNNIYKSIDLTPTYNITSTQVGSVYALRYSGTHTSLGSFTQANFVYENAGSIGGIGNTLANTKSTWDVNGSSGNAIVTSTGSLSLDGTHHTIIITSGTGTYTLPSASAATRREYVIVNQTVGARTVSSYKDLSNASQTTVGANTALWLQSDGTTWYQIK